MFVHQHRLTVSKQRIPERKAFHSRQKDAKGSSCLKRKTICWEESCESKERARARASQKVLE